MSSGKNRWSKFWWQDYERDPALRSCSLSAQGLWMRMLCFMHEGEPYGHLTINGRAPDNKRLAAMVGKSDREVSNCIAELEEAGVFSRDDFGTICSRRMIRDKAATDEAREFGKHGGNPALKGNKTTPVNGGGNEGGLTPSLNLQKLEAKRTEAKKEDPPKPPLGGGARRRGSSPKFKNGMAAIAHFMDQGLTMDEAIEEATRATSRH